MDLYILLLVKKNTRTLFIWKFLFIFIDHVWPDWQYGIVKLSIWYLKVGMICTIYIYIYIYR